MVGTCRRNSMGSGIDGASHNTAFNRWNDERNVNVNRNDSGWYASWLFAGRRNSLHFSSARAGEFCFFNCPFHPPSILPISPILSESTAYFLVSSDFVSHKIMSNSFNVSFFLVARRTYGIFSSRARNVAADTAPIDSM